MLAIALPNAQADHVPTVEPRIKGQCEYCEGVGLPCLASRTCVAHATVHRMLWDFHKWRNGQRPGTVHATYLVYGKRKQVREQDGDVEMTDSLPENEHSLSDEVPARILTLVKEESLQGTYCSQPANPTVHLTYDCLKTC